MLIIFVDHNINKEFDNLEIYRKDGSSVPNVGDKVQMDYTPAPTVVEKIWSSDLQKVWLILK